MTTNEQLTPPLAERGQARRSPTRSLVLPQSWVAFSGLRRGQPSLRQSTLQAAEAFSLLASELATRRVATEHSNA
ncbi:MAG: hypothetical protein B9S33_14065 [Pedosphaera sp. Tous-C6FEB]|nr:MAG: hypothetical protein B9S33_14065 [Pedosphaera sp. Tous-C6FEB]